ncbi:MAG: sugar phosphate isomerase/epimerase [Rhodospirillales bacterium]|nr:sugar phosphate isomerase/epimerase [Rhodospirillales bacterium]MDE2200597.1 sugar phosphate isomerase/epimerase [Rhodospirillales bacterium]MDE2574495.1 sugar phosphate isomerase/epimerase [Rhodospirillales bacterium]
MSATWAPGIGVISMSYARPFTAGELPLFARMKAAGMDFCELLVPEEDELDPALAGRAAREAGLSLLLAARVNLQRDLASDEAGARASGIAYLRRCVDVAVACGAPIVGGPLYGTPLVFAGRPPSPIAEAARQARVARVVDGLQQAGDYAASHGVVLAVEPLNRFETDFCNTARQAVDLVRDVDRPAIGVMLDTFHMNMEEDDLPMAIRETGAHLVHFQANENHRGFLGTGHLDWPAICRALASIGYGGAITLEPFRRTDHRLSVPLAQWRPPAHDEDADLARSGALLRAALHAARSHVRTA